MEFFSGMVIGGILTIGLYLAWSFYFRVEEKDKLLAEDSGKKFEEKIRLVNKDQ